MKREIANPVGFLVLQFGLDRTEEREGAKKGRKKGKGMGSREAISTSLSSLQNHKLLGVNRGGNATHGPGGEQAGRHLFLKKENLTIAGGAE